MTLHSTQLHKFECEAVMEAGCNIMPLYISKPLFKDWRPEPTPPYSSVSMVTPQ